jgi:hypothetical protein
MAFGGAAQPPAQRLVLPMPPAPVIVTMRRSGSVRASAETTSARPTRRVADCGRPLASAPDWALPSRYVGVHAAPPARRSIAQPGDVGDVAVTGTGHRQSARRSPAIVTFMLLGSTTMPGQARAISRAC